MDWKSGSRFFCAVPVITLMILAGCSSPTPARDPAKILTIRSSDALWGEMKPVVSVKELMKYVIDPVADDIFNAVGTTVTGQGLFERAPKTEEDWERILSGAIALAENAYLLKVRRPFTPAGDENNSQGPDAVELSPTQITQKVERDPVEWNARIEAMRNVALEVLEIVKRKDAAELWDAGENLDIACEACHRSYWYPGEDAEFYRRLNRRAEDSAVGRKSATR